MTQIIQQTLTLNEFHAALNKHKGRSALGVDRTTYVVWPSIEAKPALHESLKLFLATPHIKIIPTSKKGKDLNSFANFRPISLVCVLTNCIVKIVKDSEG